MNDLGPFLYRLSPLLLLPLVCLFVETSEARVSWSTGGEYRLMSYLNDAFQLSDDAALAAQDWGRHRLRLKPSMEVGIVSVHLEIDVLTGQTFGTTHDVGSGILERRHVDRSNGYDGWTTLEPRLAWFEIKGPLLSLRLGQMQSRWGLGIQSDAIEWKRPNFVSTMVEQWNGDLTDQIEVEFRPLANLSTDALSRFSLIFSVGSVYQDEYAALLDDGEAYRFSSSARIPLDNLEIGLRAQRQLVTKPDDEVLDLKSTGGFVRWAEPLLGLGSVFVFESEAVFQTVSMRESSDLEASPSEEFEGYGMVLAAEYFVLCPQVGLRLEGGISRGDGGTSADSVYHMDPDFKPSVLALPVVERWLSAHYSKRQVVVDSLSAGARTMLPSDGSVRSMAYSTMKASWRYARFMLTGAGTLLWRTGDLETVGGSARH